MNSELVITTFEAAKILSVDISTVINWINAGRIAAYKTPGGHRRIKLSDLREFAEKYSLPQAEEIAKMIADTGAASVRAPLKVLAVDDDAGVLHFVATAVEHIIKNVSVAVASDGLEAGEKIAEFRPDVLILDIKLPGIDGFEVLRRLKKRNMKILAISAFPSDETRRKILAAGADAFLVKPFDIAELKKTILSLAPEAAWVD
ncbi:MAG: histidine kinase [Elusimicrobia bacterium HGW-Elusimicrobia-1]|jgi:excisionase family DNA binding protein|nr:MAG: histidine kinase [Elusimicrobia bacterium HGW-Elusimicrobia-1]